MGSKLKTMFFAKDMRVLKDIYRKHHDKIVWSTHNNIEEIEVKPGHKIITFKNDKEN